MPSEKFQAAWLYFTIYHQLNHEFCLVSLVQTIPYAAATIFPYRLQNPKFFQNALTPHARYLSRCGNMRILAAGGNTGQHFLHSQPDFGRTCAVAGNR